MDVGNDTSMISRARAKGVRIRDARQIEETADGEEPSSNLLDVNLPIGLECMEEILDDRAAYADCLSTRR